MARSFSSAGNQIAAGSFGAPPAQGTISIWIRPNWNGGDSTTHEFWQFATSGPSDRPSFQKFSDNNIYAGFNGSGLGEQRIIIPGSSLFTLGVWANWVFTYSSAGCVLYKNGVSVGTKGAITIPALGTSYQLGRLPGSSANCNSGLAEFALWNTIFSANEALALSRGISPLILRPSSLLLYLPIFGLGSGEPDWGPSHYAQSLSGTTFQTHAPVSLYVPPTPTNGTVLIIITAAIAAYQQSDYGAVSLSEAIATALVAYQQSNSISLSISELMTAAIAAYQQTDRSAVSLTQVMAGTIAAYQGPDFSSLSLTQVIAATLTAAQPSDFSSISDREIITAIIAAFQSSDFAEIFIPRNTVIAKACLSAASLYDAGLKATAAYNAAVSCFSLTCGAS